MSDIVYQVSGGRVTVKCLRCGATAEADIHLGVVGHLGLYHEDDCPVLAQDTATAIIGFDAADQPGPNG